MILFRAVSVSSENLVLPDEAQVWSLEVRILSLEVGILSLGVGILSLEAGILSLEAGCTAPAKRLETLRNPDQRLKKGQIAEPSLEMTQRRGEASCFLARLQYGFIRDQQ